MVKRVIEIVASRDVIVALATGAIISILTLAIADPENNLWGTPIKAWCAVVSGFGLWENNSVSCLMAGW